MPLAGFVCALAIGFSAHAEATFSEEWFHGLPPLDHPSWFVAPDCVESHGWLVTPEGFPEFDPVSPLIVQPHSQRLGI